MDTLLQDLRLALRALLHRPVFTAVAAASLAVGLGATTAMLGVVDVMVFRSLPGIPGWDRAVELGRSTGGRGFDTFSHPEIADLSEGVPALEAVAGYAFQTFSWDTGEGGERVQGQLVTASYFEALGVRPGLGRFFSHAVDDGVGTHPEVVISHDFWQNRLGGTPDIVGSTLRINRVPLTVIGVAPPAFTGHVIALESDLWIPLTMGPALQAFPESRFGDRRASSLQAIARLAPRATVETADAQVKALFGRLEEAHPESNRRRSARVIALGPLPGGGRGAVVGFLGVLTGLAVIVLLVTCANVAGMFLARAATRRREVAIRLALGSGRAHLVRRLLTEVVVVFLLGGLGGLLVARWTAGLIDFGALPVPVDLGLDLSPDPRVLLFGLLVALLAGLSFGLAPALQALRTDLVPALKADAATGGPRTSWLRRAFASAQIGLSLVLLLSAALFARALESAGSPQGFEARDVHATSVELDLEGYDAVSGRAFQERLRDRLAALPGVDAAALAIDLPLDLSSYGTGVRPEGAPAGEEPIDVGFNHVTPGYFATLRIPLLRGRAFDAGDGPDSEPVAIVSRAFADRLWPGEEAIGRRFDYLLSDGGGLVTVVGVVEDTQNQTVMDDPGPFVYRPLAQAYRADVSALVRSERPAGEVATALRSAILGLDPSLSLGRVHSVERLTSVGVLPQRIAATVAGALATVAMVLAGLGIYGVIAYAVAGRRREIGVRMALGAGSGRVVRRVLGDGVRLALPGLLVGALIAGTVATLLGKLGLLLDVSPWDPFAVVGVSLLLLSTVAVASAVPARRAIGVPPAEALRAE